MLVGLCIPMMKHVLPQRCANYFWRWVKILIAKV
jgi:hypothetical protein